MPAAGDRPRRPVGTRLLVAFAAERGVTPAVALDGTGLTAAQLEDPDTLIDRAQELLAYRTVVRRLGDAPGLGAALGRRFSLAHHGDLGFALMTRATGRDALALALRFLEASDALVRFDARADGEDAVLALHADDLPPGLRAFATERDVAAIAGVIASIVPGVHLRVGLALEPARVAAVAAVAPEHEVLAAGSAGPSRPLATLRLAAAALDTPLPNADAASARTFERRLQEQLRRATPRPAAGRGSVAARVAGVLLDALPRRVGAPEAAAALHVAPRTLRRHLEGEGTSFQAVADATLRDLAQDLLRQDLPVADVAARLGYAEAASFTRAFRRWTGASPRAWARSGT
jgi:AraC-like DNA-binding protein